MRSQCFGLSICLAVLSAIVIAPTMADDVTQKKQTRKSQGPILTTQLIKKLEVVKLTEEQVAKIQEIGTVANQKVKEIRERVGLTRDLTKKLDEAQKSMKDSDLKRKELVAAIHEKAGLNQQQSAAIQEVNAIRLKLQQDSIALLTDAQKANLPAQMKREPKKNGEPKKKKNVQ